MMFQKLKYLFLKTWLLIYFGADKSFPKTMNKTNSKLQTTPGFEVIKQLEK